MSVRVKREKSKRIFEQEHPATLPGLRVVPHLPNQQSNNETVVLSNTNSACVQFQFPLRIQFSSNSSVPKLRGENERSIQLDLIRPA
jgi:hypothetical protein